MYCGFWRNTEVVCDVKVVTPEIGQIDCLECKGTGWWGYGPTEAECGPCVDCKGTGKVYVSI